jgi:uncharacterized protein CbrC (UPF0167 family)
VQAAILEAIEAGNYKSTAAQAAGIHRDTLNGWELRGKAGEEPYASFSDALLKAEAKAEMDLLAEIKAARPGITGVQGADLWQARCWVMERRFASRWCARVKQQVTEHVDALTEKLKADPELHRKVIDVLADQEPAASGAGSKH